MLKKFLIGLLVIASFSGCLKSSDFPDPCNYDRCEIKAPASEIQQVQAYLTANGITNAIQHCSGMFYVVDNPGSGATPQNCSAISVTYEGKLTNNTVFDSSTTPVSFNLSQVINGWRNGLPEVKAGGSIRLYIPPSLGYGDRLVGTIPPNSILIFRVDLITVQ